MQNELYQPNEYVVIRTPINSTEEFCHLFSNAKLTKQRIQNLKEDSCFRELLKTASHDLAQYFLDENAACTDKLLHSGIKYAIRIYTKKDLVLSTLGMLIWPELDQKRRKYQSETAR